MTLNYQLSAMTLNQGEDEECRSWEVGREDGEEEEGMDTFGEVVQVQNDS